MIERTATHGHIDTIQVAIEIEISLLQCYASVTDRSIWLGTTVAVPPAVTAMAVGINSGDEVNSLLGQ